MTLIRPNGFIISASSQTGTWAEEEAAAATAAVNPTPAQRPTSIPTPRLLSRKSQRLDTSIATPQTPPTSSSSPTEPQIDASTLLLGIGWTALPSASAENDAAAAVRGWNRYLANHHPITNPSILLRSAGLAAYLVKADEGFFMFRENLDEGQLVGRTEEEALANLRKSPTGTVEGSEVLRAVGSPKRKESDAEVEKVDEGMELD
jgi:hypothetical protein